MRHSKVVNHLGRTSSHRNAMLANMAVSLIKNKRITTTLAKAKALKSYVEPLITRSKEDSTHSRRVVFSYLQDKEAVTELFREISLKIADRPGGYTRILRIGNRLGDNAEMCVLELVDYNEAMLKSPDSGKTKTTRRRRSSKKKEEAVAETAETAVAIEDTKLESAKTTEEVEAETVTEAEVEAETEPETKAETEPEPETKAETGSELEAGPETPKE
jgi:large subunit ribosomal protein L17